jgi:hypothetical protein
VTVGVGVEVGGSGVDVLVGKGVLVGVAVGANKPVPQLDNSNEQTTINIKALFRFIFIAPDSLRIHDTAGGMTCQSSCDRQISSL